MLYKIYQEIYIHVYDYNLKIMQFIFQTNFVGKSLHQYRFSCKAAVNYIKCKLSIIQCTHFTDLLSNLKGLLDSMIIKVFIMMQNVSCSQMCQNHQTFTSWSLVHNFHMCYNNYIFIYILRTLLVMNISYFLNLHYWLPLLENLATVKLSFLKHCQKFFFHIIFITRRFGVIVTPLSRD